MKMWENYTKNVYVILARLQNTSLLMLFWFFFSSLAKHCGKEKLTRKVQACLSYVEIAVCNIVKFNIVKFVFLQHARALTDTYGCKHARTHTHTLSFSALAIHSGIPYQ